MPLSCTQAQQKLQTLKSLKTDFDLAVAKFAASGKKEDAEKATQIKEIFDKAVKELKNELPQEGEFILKNIPKWDKLPDSETLMREFKLDGIGDEEYRADRIMTNIELQNKTEGPSIAKIFDIDDIIRQKQQENPNHSYSLTTNEILETIDRAGYRPAALEELLAFSRDFWKPNADPKVLHIQGLNSVFLDDEGYRYAPCLSWDGYQRRLDERGLRFDWYLQHDFLVIRKSA